jgi:hypothetical protein
MLCRWCHKFGLGDLFQIFSFNFLSFSLSPFGEAHRHSHHFPTRFRFLAS